MHSPKIGFGRHFLRNPLGIELEHRQKAQQKNIEFMCHGILIYFRKL